MQPYYSKYFVIENYLHFRTALTTSVHTTSAHTTSDDLRNFSYFVIEAYEASGNRSIIITQSQQYSYYNQYSGATASSL
jgi:hypothetical protein